MLAISALGQRDNDDPDEHIYQGVTYYSQYGHVRKILVDVGENVSKGQQIAEIGKEGIIGSNAHVHFEIRTTSHPDPTNGAYWQNCSDPANSRYHVLQDEMNVNEWYEDPLAFVLSHPAYSPNGSVIRAYNGAVVLTKVTVDNAARAGVLNAGTFMSLENTKIGCSAFELDGEDFEGVNYRFEDRGGNACGCPNAVNACIAESTSLAPPEPIPPLVP